MSSLDSQGDNQCWQFTFKATTEIQVHSERVWLSWLAKFNQNGCCEISAHREIFQIEQFQNFGYFLENFNLASFRNFHGSISSLPGLSQGNHGFRDIHEKSNSVNDILVKNVICDFGKENLFSKFYFTPKTNIFKRTCEWNIACSF